VVLALLRDLRYSVRSLVRSPAFTTVLLATVAIGVGSQAAIGGFVNGLLTRDLALPDAPRLASVYWRDGDRFEPVPYERYVALRQAASSFDAIAAFRESRANVTVNGHWSWLSIGAATPEIWVATGVEPALGRMTFADEGRDASPTGVVIAYRLCGETSFWGARMRSAPRSSSTDGADISWVSRPNGSKACTWGARSTPGSRWTRRRPNARPPSGFSGVSSRTRL
jgi:hypothetical protein